MLYRLALIIAATILFGYAAGSAVVGSASVLGLGGQVGAAAGAVLSAMAAVCLRRKPLALALAVWLGPTAVVIAALAPWAAPWVTLTLALLFAFVLCAVICVQMEDFDAARPNHCERCGYDLLGVEGGVCPECGTAQLPIQTGHEAEAGTRTGGV